MSPGTGSIEVRGSYGLYAGTPFCNLVDSSKGPCGRMYGLVAPIIPSSDVGLPGRIGPGAIGPIEGMSGPGIGGVGGPNIMDPANLDAVSGAAISRPPNAEQCL